MIKKLLKKIIPKKLRLTIQSSLLKYYNCFPFGHYYSPIVSKSDISEFENQIWEEQNNIQLPGINLEPDKQIKLLKQFELYYGELPFEDSKNSNLRYYYKNQSYSYTDAIILYSFIRYFSPKKIIEVGSGFSSAVMMDTNEIFKLGIDFTFIEPYPNLLYKIFKDNDKVEKKLFATKVQNVSIEEFKKLNKNDILFIDSSHISKTGSDVNYELFKILPNLNSGVIIHFHDIFYPFEYPKEWVIEGRNWNENYLLRAFLAYNNDFEILFFSDYIHKHYKNNFKNMPLTYKNTGGNLWIVKK